MKLETLKKKATVDTRMNRFDPTRTTFLRQAFVRQMRVRFKALRGIIRKAIVDQDCFGLQNKETKVFDKKDMSLPLKRAFDFPESKDKIKAFMDWLHKQVEDGIIEMRTAPQLGKAIYKPWTDQYILDSYERGVIRARSEMIHAGYKVPTLKETGGITASMSGPLHIQRVGVLYTRVYSGLKGITDAMEHQISQVLAQGMIDGKNPRELAKLLTKTISGPIGDLGIKDTLGRFIPAERRAETLARTEVIRAHHLGNITEMENWKVAGVRVRAEWDSAEDSRVCPICAGLEGQVFTLTKIRDMIPAHPNCRCCAIPTEPKKIKKRVSKTTKPTETTKPTSAKPKPKKMTKEEAYKQWKSKEKEFDNALKDKDYEKLKRVDVDGAYFKYVSLLSDKEYEKEREKVLKDIFSVKGKDWKISNRCRKTFSTNMKRNLRAGTDWIPFDVLYTLRGNSLSALFVKGLNRGYYDPNLEEVVVRPLSTYDIIAHEFGHAIEDLIGGYDDLHVKADQGFGFQWTDNRFVTSKDAQELVKEYNSLCSGDIGEYSNGDGEYHKNNWINDYEGRIYKGGGVGIEWWAMNIQRYVRYRHLSKNLPYEDELKEKAALKASEWGKAKERYPKLAKFIEENFGRKFMRRDIER